jgi:hypothetical protein
MLGQALVDLRVRDPSTKMGVPFSCEMGLMRFG